MKKFISNSVLTATFTLITGITAFNCSMIANQMNGELQKEVEEVKMANYLIAGLLIPPAVPAAASALPNVTDNGDGTVYVRSQNLTWAKCSQSSTTGGNMFNNAANNCSSAAAVTMQYCDAATDSCNFTSDPRILNGAGISQAYNSCHLLNGYLPGHSWRVPTISELKEFHDDIYPSHTTLFPGTAASPYWSSSAHVTNITEAWFVDFSLDIFGPNSKTNLFYVRCVRS
ncbi:MAG: DUF1566 domain-containing protein, partial [Spirochaetia bacterium]|nr:DUF1566 domain-containing protein [Spirochaetia bacterium]